MEKEKNIWKRMTSFLKDARGEMKKVTWPSKNDLYKTTVAVIVSSVVFGVYLFGVDLVFSRLIKQIMNLFK
jgi:preprotein translocase subunit SecE